ncbi:MAG: type II secretion system protein GspM [Metallibacterium scheffleri]|uniref:type II secretion system protein GspM n=1 Tax=Metallibacterium scheffleri TaxID=993689 RepID=UPI0026F02DC3|nr:type II secretion system protein GspM [Metallibacterium scheffleri]MCK9366553.1 type II secretion system protein GspM [Metallibacterium scheffleri]
MRKLRPIEAQLLAWLALAAVVALLIVGIVDPLFIAPLQHDRTERVRMTEAERDAIQDISRGEMLAHVRRFAGARSVIRDFELPAHASNAAAAELLQTVQSILLASTRQGTGCVSLSESPLHAQDPESSPYRTARLSVVMSCGTDDLAKVLAHIEGSHPLLIITTLDAYQAPVVDTTPGTIPRPLEAHLIVEGFWQPSVHP